MPGFSIIIPVYNVAPYLRECLDSVVAQTFADWEAICVDDGSTDGSGAILDGYAARDGRFRVIHQVNAGVSAARNAALDVAQGEWIGFVDADDVLLSNRLANVADVIAQNRSAEVIRTGWTTWTGEEQLPRSQCGNGPVGYPKGDQSTAALWRAVSKCGFPFVTYYMRKNADNLRYVKGIRFREDALFQYTLALNGPELMLIPENGYLRREREGSATFQSRRRDDSYRLLNEYLGIWKKLCGRHVRGMCKASSTFWIAKDIGEWFKLCPERRVHDSFKVWIAVWRLTTNGAFSPFSCGSKFDGLRRLVYLFTGAGGILSFTRLSFARGGRLG